MTSDLSERRATHYECTSADPTKEKVLAMISIPIQSTSCHHIQLHLSSSALLVVTAMPSAGNNRHAFASSRSLDSSILPQLDQQNHRHKVGKCLVRHKTEGDVGAVKSNKGRPYPGQIETFKNCGPIQHWKRHGKRIRKHSSKQSCRPVNKAIGKDKKL